MVDTQPHNGLRRGILAGVFVVFFLLLFTVWQALTVRVALNDVAIRMTSMVDDLSQGRAKQAERHLAAAQEEASKAQRNTTGPVWWIASRMPWMGDDVTAVRTVASVADDLTEDTLPPLVEEGADFGPQALQPVDGRFDLERIAAAAPVFTAGAIEIASADDRVRDLDTGGLVGPLQGPVGDVQKKLSTAAAASETAATAAQLLPGMLGGEGKRTYLLLFQNNAEIRAQGGMPGAVAIVEAEDGIVEMVRQGAPRTIGNFPEPFIKLTAEEKALFTTRAAIYPQDTTFIPDFARSSDMISRMWERTQPESIDGVISVDPVALSYMLRGTGPVALGNGKELTTSNADEYLMRDVYLTEPDGEVQNAIFADAARRVFDALTSGSNDPKALLAGLGQATSERRLMLWSDRADEEGRIEGTAIAGLLPTEPQARPEVGVYLNDAAADKLSYYLDYKVDVQARSCSAERQTLDVKVTMTSTVPKGVTLPRSVVGPPDNPTRPGELLNSIYLYAPADGYIDSALLDGQEAAVADYAYRGRDVGAVTVGLQRGQTRTLDYTIRTGMGETGDPHLITTPAAVGSGLGKVSASAC